MPTTSGHYQQLDGRPAVRFERTFPHPVAAVWEAVTDPEQLQEWFPTTVEFGALRPGAPMRFHFPQDAYEPMSGVLKEVEPLRRLVFTWGSDELTFELSEAADGAACRLAFTVVLDSEDKAARDSAGWEGCLDMLAQVAGGGAPQRTAGRERWKQYYEEYRRQGLPATAAIPE
jgi:uncharacterized protein YndB with AHSA1/START domain